MTGWWAASYAVLWALVIFLAVMVVALARQIGTLHLRLGPLGALEMDDEGPPLGEAVPPVDVTDLAGERHTIGGPGADRLLLFISPGCMVCQQVLPSLAPVARQANMAAYVITDADAYETSTIYEGKRVGAPVASSSSAARAYDVPGTPYLVVLDDLGVVRAKGTVNNLEQMEGLIDTARSRIDQVREQRRVM